MYNMFFPLQVTSTGRWRLSWLLVVAAAAAGGYVLLVEWFEHTDFYGAHFFDHGTLVTQYNLLRVLFIGAIVWLVYAPGAALLAVVGGQKTLQQLPARERYALGFFSGAGAWHLILLCVGLAGGYKRSVAEALTFSVMLLSVPHLLFCVDEARCALPKVLLCPRGVRFWRAVLLILLLVAAALFVGTKGLYPAGGHDYYTHYFYYYVSVLHHGSILPNEVWYHFYYSKGAGLYFLAMLLTDPLAPQLVSTAFIAAGALTVAVMLNRAAPGTLLPWIGVVLYITFLIYTPGPLENLAHGGWGDLEKLHEPAAVMFLGVVWISTHMATTQGEQRRMWLTGLACAIVATILITTVVAVFVGAFFTTLTAWGILWRQESLISTAFFGAAVAGISLGAILVVNYALTGLPLDQAILYAWPIVDLEKIERWGVLNEVLVAHWGLTGYLANKLPLAWNVAPLLLKYLRLEIWFPIAIIGVVAMTLGLCAGRWRELLASEGFASTVRSLLIFIVMFSLIAIGLGVGRQQPISFYRFTSFTYAPVLCTALLLCFALPGCPSFRGASTSIASVSLLALLLLAKEPLWPSVLGDSMYPYVISKHRNDVRNIFVNAGFFLRGRFSLKDAYQNQQGWPGRLPWGGLYPPMEKIWEIVGRGTPIYSMHVHGYCMLPECPVYGFMSTRVTPEMDVVLFGEPKQAIKALRQAGINFFFVSKELTIVAPIVLSPVLAPDKIMRYLGVKWTDGTSYLLTWLENAERPIDQQFLVAYKKQIRESGTLRSFPINEFKAVFDHFREKGPQPYRLPWCTTCDGMSATK